MTKHAYFGPNLAVLGPNILIFTGGSKSFGTHITHGQNWPAANFRQKGVWSPMYSHHFTFYDPSQYLSSFLKTACLGGHESGFPDFGKSCMPNYWHQINFLATPENFGV